MATFSRKMMMMGVFATVLVSLTSVAQAQAPANDMSCLQALMPCSAALNSTGTPPATCCDPLREAVEKQLPCLCALFQNTDLAAATNINITRALELPVQCGISADPSICTKGQGAASPAPAPMSGGPPAATTPTAPTPGASTPAGTNAGSSVAWTGSVSTSMFILVALMSYY